LAEPKNGLWFKGSRNRTDKGSPRLADEMPPGPRPTCRVSTLRATILDDAMTNAGEAAELYVEGLRDDGDPLDSGVVRRAIP